MKALFLRMKAFGCYLHETSLNFESLGEHPLFLITGNTGGGKTTILDAMCFALYGKATGGQRSWDSMRSLSAAMKEETFVEFTFALSGKIYKFYREQKHYAGRGTGEEKVKETNECWKKDHLGEWKLLESGSDKTIREWAEKLLGLNCEQFSQVVVLPQGDFLRLLMSNSMKKASLLQTLFHAGKWKILTQRMRDKERALSREAGENLASKNSILERESSSSGEELENFCKNQRIKISELIKEHEKSQTELERQNRAYQLAAALDTSQKMLISCRKEQEESSQRAKNAAEEKRQAEAFLPKAEEAKKKADSLREKRGSFRMALEGVNRLQSVEEHCQKLKKQAEEQRKVKEAAEKEWNETSVRCEKGNAYIEEMSEAASFLPSLSAQIEQEINKNAAAAVAIHLENGKPCPVCGSLEHPIPAEPSLILQALIKRRKETQEAVEKLEKARKKLKQLEQEREKARDQVQLAEKAQNLLGQSLAAEEAKIEELSKTVQGNSSAAELKSVLEKIERSISGCETMEKEITERMQLAQRSMAAAAASLESAKKAFLNAQETDRRALEAYHMAYGEQAERPNVEAIGQTRKEAQDHVAELSAQKGAAQERLQSAEKSLEQLKQLETQGEKLQEQYARVSRLAKLLSGDSAMKIPIQNFVLGVMLDEILQSANLFFADLSGNRYQLIRATEESNGNARGGLDLQVLDAAAGGAREVATLSGGELFLASLSLAFGLSDVVQSTSGSVRLDSIFIDEGFGSLDQETLDTAMNALLRLQQSGRTVGIISHVTELESAIPLQVRVGKLSDGTGTLRVKTL